MRNGWTKFFRRHDSRFLLTAVRDAYGNTLVLQYDGPTLVRIQAQNGRFVVIERDANGRIRRIADEQGRAVGYLYDDSGLLRTVTDIGGNEWQYDYDVLGRLKLAVDPQGVSILEVQSDAIHRASVVRILGGQYRYRYEDARTTIQDEAGRAAYVLHNRFGIATSVTSTTGFASEVRLDSQNRVTTLLQDFEPRATFSYGANEQLETLTRSDEGGSVILSYVYDTLNRPTEIIGSDGSKTTLAFNEAGDLLRRQDGEYWEQFEYTEHGDLRAVANSRGSTTYAHNSDGQIETITSSRGSATFVYFPNGRLKLLTLLDGSTHEYGYDALGLRKSIKRSNDRDIAYWYDAAGNLIRSSGLDASGRDVGQTFEIDSYYRAKAVHHDDGHITKITYDSAGNPETISRFEDPAKPVLSYMYDARNRLIAVADGEKIIGSYAYDKREADLRDQLDHHTMRVAAIGLQHSATLGNIDSILYTRPYGSTFEFVNFDEATQSFELAADIAMVFPDLVRNNSIHRRELSELDTGSIEAQVNFDRPSNISFLPPEYATINCAQNCVFYGVEIRANGSYDPITVSTGSTVTLQAGSPEGTANEGCQLLICDWTIGGQNGGSGKTIYHTFSIPGTYHVVTNCECSPCDITGADDTFVDVVDPVCNVDFSITPASPKISTAPAMPSISASVTSRTPSNASISWTASVSHTAPSGCTGGPTFSANAQNASGTTYAPTFSGLFGGELTIKATCSAAGYQSKTTTKKLNVGGTQPSDTLIGNQIGTVGSPFDSADLRRIGCHESNLTQFTGTNGFPLYGGGGDTGIMQICFQRTSSDLWNWQANIERGRSILMEKRTNAKNCLDNEVNTEGATPYTNTMWRKEAIHRYNAGSACVGDAYQEWNSTVNAWVVVDRGGAGGYVNAVLAKGPTCT